MTRKPVCLGVQWEPTSTRGVNICVGPDRPNDGGESTATFEHGAYLNAFEFEVSVKDVPEAYELLCGLIVTDTAGNHTPILRTYLRSSSHPGGQARVCRSMPDDMRIVPGGKVWAYLVGWGVTNTEYLSTEVHATLMVDGGATVSLA